MDRKIKKGELSSDVNNFKKALKETTEHIVPALKKMAKLKTKKFNKADIGYIQKVVQAYMQNHGNQSKHEFIETMALDQMMKMMGLKSK